MKNTLILLPNSETFKAYSVVAEIKKQKNFKIKYSSYAGLLCRANNVFEEYTKYIGAGSEENTPVSTN